MARGIEKLSERRVKTEKRVGVHSDGAGLYLKVTPSGTKSWVFRYQLDGKSHNMGLGAVHTISLVEARAKARDLRRIKLDGHDPLAARAEARARAKTAIAGVLTFRQAAEEWVAALREGWTPKHALQITRAIERFIDGKIGGLPVADIDTAAVMAVLQPIWVGKNFAAVQCRGIIEKVLDRAKALEHRSGENPARWRGHLAELLSAPAKLREQKLRGTDDDGHHPMLPYKELPVFMSELRATDGDTPRVIEFAILTAARIGEVLQANWRQIDLEARTWTIPPGHMKAARQHVVLLSEPAIALLRALPKREDGRVFGLKWSAYANRVLTRLSPGVTLHGFRSTFSTWAHETTSFDHDTIETSLAHTTGNAVSRAYDRGDRATKRRDLMAAWASFCGTPAGGNVVAIGGAA